MAAQILNEKLNGQTLTGNFENSKYFENNLDRTTMIDLKGAEKKIAGSITDVNEIVEEKRTDIQEFYNGKNIFVTGGTGFLGKILIEKLLRCCRGAEVVFLLVRQKRGKDIYTRVDEIFDDPIFNRLKEEVPKFRHKIVPISGDCGSAGLGLTLTDRQMLIEKVNIIFHSAATVKFDEHLRIALGTNVYASLNILNLARDMKGLDVMMHVSTAYSNSHLTEVEESFYPCPVDFDQLSNLVDKLDNDEIDDLLPTVLGPWPNTYTFTKALAEKELRANAGSVPVGIFRPAIVTSTTKEPIPNWIDNMYGPTGIVAGAATGVLRTLQCDADVTAEIVPVDMVVNCLLATARNVHISYKKSPSPPPEPPIFNYVSSPERRLTWGSFMEINLKNISLAPVSSALWYISVTMTRSSFLNSVLIVFLHLLPAILADGLAICVGQKPKMLKVYRKVHKFSSVVVYFCTTEIRFCNKRVRALWSDTSDEDKEMFPFSMSDLDWDEYFKGYIFGLRKYIFKESEDTLPKALIKWRRLYILHNVVRAVFIVLSCYFIWSVLSIIF